MVETAGGGKIFSLQTRYTDPFRKKLFSIASTVAESMLLLQQLNDIYNNISRKNETNLFLKDVLDNLNIRYSLSEEDRMRIPTQDPAIVVANHPFGAIEGIILADILRSRRPDVKIMANHLLKCIPEMKELFIFVDPFGTRDALKDNVKPLKEAIRWVRNGAMLGLFPAGEVSHLRLPGTEITDPEWTNTIAGIIRKTGAAVIPVYFDGTNSAFFQMAGLVHRRLRTALLPRELLNKCNKDIQVYVGNPVSFERLSTLQTDREVMSYLRFRTYALRHRRKKNSIVKGGGMPSSSDEEKMTVPTSVIVNSHLISLEIRNLEQNNVLIENDECVVYHAKAHEIPNLLQEIGRLREITFRQIGEGTGKAIDLDRFDLYYNHLFLWNKKRHEVVGAYRLGDVNAIIQRYGENGLYTKTLFQYRPAFLQQINNALELGRSFIRLEYQKLYFPLFLLWKGIGHFVARYPQHKTLFGPVTISNSYNTLSRQLMVSYLKTNNYTPDLAKLVKPRMPIRLTSLKGRETQTFTTLIKDMEELSGLISDIECDQKGIPVLLRHYVKLGGKMVGFSLDRSFSNGLDGLIMVDLTKYDTKLLRHYMGKEGAAVFLSQLSGQVFNVLAKYILTTRTFWIIWIDPAATFKTGICRDT
jgi:putative hemolysin